MEKLVVTVFKILGFSIILMMLLDISFTLIDTYNVYMKVSNVGNLMQNEVARHNGLPEGAMADTFGEMLVDIAERSRVVDGVGANFESSVTSSTVDVKFDDTDYQGYECLTSSIKNYGEMCDLTIRVRINTLGYAMPNAKMDNFRRVTLGNSVLVFNYRVPCLRYLK